MLIVCPSCATGYKIELSTIGSTGRTVRCARCRNVWFASAEDITAGTIDIPAQEDDDLGPILPESTLRRRADPPPATTEAADEGPGDFGIGDWSTGTAEESGPDVSSDPLA